jgi:oxidase EvaA
MASRFLAPALAGENAMSPGHAFSDWWAGRQKAHHFEVTRIPFAGLDGWCFEPDSGNLAHESKRFFTIEGMRVSGDGDAGWSQPIINQPEIGILGILAKEFGGVLHFLMQAKMEPGNVNTLQLSPTVQATRSNYTRVHRGSKTRYLEYFVGPRRGQVLVDVLQSEQGAWFWRKHNRNMVVQVTEDVPQHEDFHWLTLDQLRKLLWINDLVNMDVRTVLGCMPMTCPPDRQQSAADPFIAALRRSYDTGDGGPASLHSQSEILSWLTDAKLDSGLRPRLIPLAKVENWSRTDDEISDDRREQFRIVAVRVRAANREVAQWAQPLLAPHRQGLAAFLAKPIKGVLHLLVRTRPEAGLPNLVEMAPTVQLPSPVGTADPDPLLEYVTGVDPSCVRYDAVLSEEGGRFYHARTRYQVIEVGDDFPLETPPDLRWMTVHQLIELLRHSHYLNVEARSLLACVHSLW